MQPRSAWAELEKRKLRKTFDFSAAHPRLTFVVQLLSMNDQIGDIYKLLVDGLSVTVGIEADGECFIGDRERKHARRADEIYAEIRRYAASDS